jgi:hypothetical protein
MMFRAGGNVPCKVFPLLMRQSMPRDMSRFWAKSGTVWEATSRQGALPDSTVHAVVLRGSAARSNAPSIALSL